MEALEKQVLVVEDQYASMEKICRQMEGLDDLIILRAPNSETAYRYAMEYGIDLFVVDIILNTKAFGDISGLKFIESIRTIEQYKFTPIIITTSLEDPKFHAYAHLHCFRYFEKPYDKEEFREAVKLALEYKAIKKAKDFYSYKDDGIIYSVKIKNIVYFQTVQRVTHIYCKNGKVLHAPYKSNKNILLEINSEKFLRCSNDTIVNVEFIDSIDSTNRYIMLKNDFEALELGPKIKKKFLKDFSEC